MEPDSEVGVAWCYLQVKLCDPCLSALSVPSWPKKRHINTLPLLSLGSNVPESESERQSVTSDAGDTGPGVLQDVASTSTHTEWIAATDKYVSPADISFTATAAIMQPCDLTGDSHTIEFFRSPTMLLIYLLIRQINMPCNT